MTISKVVGIMKVNYNYKDSKKKKATQKEKKKQPHYIIQCRKHDSMMRPKLSLFEYSFLLKHLLVINVNVHSE